ETAEQGLREGEGDGDGQTRGETNDSARHGVLRPTFIQDFEEAFVKRRRCWTRSPLTRACRDSRREGEKRAASEALSTRDGRVDANARATRAQLGAPCPSRRPKHVGAHTARRPGVIV